MPDNTKKKNIPVRLPVDLWKRAKDKMFEETGGENFQALYIELLTQYVKSTQPAPVAQPVSLSSDTIPTGLSDSDLRFVELLRLAETVQAERWKRMRESVKYQLWEVADAAAEEQGLPSPLPLAPRHQEIKAPVTHAVKRGSPGKRDPR